MLRGSYLFIPDVIIILRFLPLVPPPFLSNAVVTMKEVVFILYHSLWIVNSRTETVGHRC